MKLKFTKQQEKKINSLFEKYKTDKDLIDISAIWDSTLKDEENLSNLSELVKTLASADDVTKKIEGDKKTKKSSIKHEKDEKARQELEQLKKQEEKTKKELDKSINEIKLGTTKDLEKSFHIIKELVNVLIKSDYINGLILKGNAGLGKSFNCIKSLKSLGFKKGKNFEMLGCYTTPLEFYKFLYENKDNKVLILDDTIGFFNNRINVGLVLASLWGEGRRIVRYNSSTGRLKNIPMSFIFNSKIIWCANDLPKEIEAVKSRCYFYEIKFSYNEILKLFYEIGKLNKINSEVIDYIKENTDESTENFDFRLLFKINEIYRNNKKNWKEIANKLLGLNKNESLALLKKLINTCSSIPEARKKWCEETGKHTATFYRNKLKLFANSQ